jgi:hypothetical protein
MTIFNDHSYFVLIISFPINAAWTSDIAISFEWPFFLFYAGISSSLRVTFLPLHDIDYSNVSTFKSSTIVDLGFRKVLIIEINLPWYNELHYRWKKSTILLLERLRVNRGWKKGNHQKNDNQLNFSLCLILIWTSCSIKSIYFSLFEIIQ